MQRVVKIAFALCLIVYLVVLVKLIIFKYPDAMMQEILNGWSLEGVGRSLRAANLIPFKTIGSALFSSSLPVEIPTLVYNIVAFVPLGFLLPFLVERVRKWPVMLIIGVLVSCAFEAIQLVTILGAADIDDVILNGAGTMIGYGCYKAASAMLRNTRALVSPAKG